MDAWLTNFANALTNSEAATAATTAQNTQVGPTASSTIANILANRLNTTATPGTFAHPSGDSNFFSGLKSDVLGGGQRLLDILSRGNYASANMDKYFQEHQGNGFLSDLEQIPGALAAAGRGLAGTEKTTYEDVNKGMLNGNPINDAAVHGTSFLENILLDPTTYIPGKAIAGGLGKLAEIAGVDVSKLGRATNPILTPEAKAATDLAAEGTTTVPTSNSAKLLNTFNASPSPTERAFNTVDTSDPVITDAAHLLPPANPATFIGSTSGAPAIRPLNQTTQRLAAASHLSSLQTAKDAMLKGVHSYAYKPGTTVDPLWRDAKVQVPEKYMDNVTETLPKMPTEQFINEGLRNLHGAAAKGPGESVKIFTREGKPIPKAVEQAAMPSDKEWSKLSEEEQIAVAKNFGKDVQKGPAGHYTSVKLDTLANAVKSGGKLPDVIKDAHIRVGAKLEPLADHIKKLHEAAAEHDIFGEGESVTKQVEKERLVEKVVKQRLSPSETLAWSVKHADVLSPQDMIDIRKSVGLGPKSVETTMQKILGRVGPKDYESIEELQHARRNGMLTPEGEEQVKNAMSQAGIKYLPEIDRKLEAASKRANEVSGIKPQPKEEAFKNAATSASEDIDRPLPETMWGNPTVRTGVTSKIADAVGGNLKDFAKAPIDLAPQQAKIVAEELSKVSDLKNSTRANAAGNRYFNRYSQMTLGKGIVRRAAGLVSKADDTTRPALMYDTVMPMLQAAENGLREHGVPLVLGKSGLPMSTHDILAALPRNFVEKYFTTHSTSIGLTQLTDIAEQFMKHHMGETDINSLRDSVRDILKSDMVKGVQSPLTKYLTRTNSLEKVTNEFVHAFTQAAPKLNDALTTNLSAHLIKVGDEATGITHEVIDKVSQALSDPTKSVGKIMDTLLNTKRDVAEAAKARDIPVSDEARVLAEQSSAAHAAQVAPMDRLRTVAKATKDFAKATTTSEIAHVDEGLYKAAEVEGELLLKDAGLNTFDLGLRGEFTLGTRFFTGIAPHLGNESVRPILIERMSVNQAWSRRFAALRSGLNKKYSTDELAEAVKLIQEGRPIDTPVMQDAAGLLRNHFDIEGPTDYGLLARNGITSQHLATKLARQGLRGLELNPVNPDLSWRTWDIKDPLDFMGKYNAAVSAALIDREVGAGISRNFGKLAPLDDGQKWVRVFDSKGASKIASLIDTRLYYPEDIVRQLHMFDKTMKELDKPISTNPFLKLIDSALHSYKAGVTIYRLGHHVRNLIGDAWFSSMDGVNSPLYYKRAAAVLATRPSQYKDFDALAVLKDAYSVEGHAPKSVLSMMYKGKKVTFSPDEVFRMAFQGGLYPDFSILEDVNFGGASQSASVSRFLSKFSPFKGKIHEAATGLSEYREHYMRTAHFLHAMGEQKLVGDTLQEALQSAAEKASARVRKWHPDGSDMSSAEMKYARRGLLFYSWTRKAIPLVIEAAVTHPGRFMVYPKAMHAIAAQNGINLQGFGDPFPSNQLFPSYISDTVQGPQAGGPGSYIGIKPGVPSVDMLDEFGTTPMEAFRSVMSNVTPLAKVPFEVATGNQVKTGTPIKNTADYVDAQVPFGTYIDKLAGNRSLSTGFTQPNAVSKSNANYQGSSEIPGGTLGQAFINMLLGGGLTDYSRPSSIAAARRENSAKAKP